MPPHEIIIGSLEDLCYPNSSPYATSAAVVNCISGDRCIEKEVHGKPCLGMDLADDFPIPSGKFDEAIKFINKYIAEGDVLVCCEAGSSRSVAIGMAYYMSQGKTYDEASKLLWNKAPRRIHNFSLINWALEKGYMPTEEHKKRLKEINE